MDVREIMSIPYERLQEQFAEVAHSLEFSAVATCGSSALSVRRKKMLLEAFAKAGLELAESDLTYAVSVIAGRLVNRE